MRRCGLLVSVLLAAALAGAAPAAAPAPRCGDGVTAFLAGDLRIAGLRYDSVEESGWEHLLCVRGSGWRPLRFGRDYFTSGTASGRTPAYAAGGGRYVGAFSISDGEGGPSSYVSVADLREGRSVNYANTACCGIPPFRVGADGTLVLAGGGAVFALAPRSNRSRRLSPPGVFASDLAMVGNTVYWTQGRSGEPRSAGSAVLADLPADAPESSMLRPVRFRRARPCPDARGRTTAESPRIRALVRGGRHFACRTGLERRIALPAAPRIVNDRWLLAGERVVDSRTGRTVARTPGAREATLLPDGTAAWIDAGGRVLVQPPGAGAPSVLAPEGARDLAAGRRAFYWTAADGSAMRGERPGSP